MKSILGILIVIATLSSCVTNEFEELSYISVGGDTIYDPIVIAEERVYCYGGYRFRVTVIAELSDGTSISFVLIANDLDNSEEISVHDYVSTAINSKCDGGIIYPYVNLVNKGGMVNIRDGKFDIIGSIGMECKQTEDIGFGDWRPIDADLVLNLIDITNPK